ncbi:MAG: hypothetical protein IBX68_01705 [Dehalococcoidia bacterium]|nr:hypothetical protein [Dehalococcoidia bacterium]
MAKMKGKQVGARENEKAAERGFYSRALDEADKLDFQLARGVEGIDDEIALLRMTIKSLLESDPDNVKLILEATNALARLVRTRYRISSDQKQALSSAIGSVLQNLAIPLGIKYLP